MSRYYGSIRDDDAKITKMLEDESEKAVDRGLKSCVIALTSMAYPSR